MSESVDQAFRGRLVVDPGEGKVREREGEQKKDPKEQDLTERVVNLDKAVSAIEGALSEVSEIRDELQRRVEEAGAAKEREGEGG